MRERVVEAVGIDELLLTAPAGILRIVSIKIGCQELLPLRGALLLALLYPLFSLRWCTILLNEFLPERWANRVTAGEAADWPSAKQRQLDRAQEWAHSLAATFRRFPYGE